MKIKFIAEFCQNHNGDPDVVDRMIDAAVNAGATHLKLQHIYTRNLTNRVAFETGGRDTAHGHVVFSRPYKEELQRLRELELPEEVCRRFVERCLDAGVTPLTTCFCTEHVQALSELGFREIKVASYDCASPFLLKSLKGNFDHIYVSTGATFDSEIRRAAEILQADYSFLHCVTRYPTPLQALNLNRMDWLKQFVDSVGYSDHSDATETGTFATRLALHQGAQIIERHFTILGRDETKDGRVSVSAEQISEILEFSKLGRAEQAAQLLKERPDFEVCKGGAEEFKMSEEEYQNRLYYRGRFASVKVENGLMRHVYNWEPL